MKYFVTLTGCETYNVAGKTFKKGKEVPVSKELYDYLGRKGCFSSKALPDQMPVIDQPLIEDIHDSIEFSEKITELVDKPLQEPIIKDPNAGVITVEDLGTATVKQHAADRKPGRGTKTRPKDK